MRIAQFTAAKSTAAKSTAAKSFGFKSRALTMALLAATVLPISACARHSAKGDLPYIARDVGTLYSAARHRLDQGSYKEAAQLFDEVERQHPIRSGPGARS